MSQVSIRAPRSHAGRHDCLVVLEAHIAFQSAPRVRTRGDALTAYARGFDYVVSIRAPRSHAGRLIFVKLIPTPYEVSIRAPRSHAGRPTYHPAHWPVMLFQSAPRVRTRGDFHASSALKILSCFNPRPAFARGATAAPPIGSVASP